MGLRVSRVIEGNVNDVLQGLADWSYLSKDIRSRDNLDKETAPKIKTRETTEEVPKRVRHKKKDEKSSVRLKKCRCRRKMPLLLKQEKINLKNMLKQENSNLGIDLHCQI